MAPLTYNRLKTRLDALLDGVPGQMPGPENAQRRKDVQQVINDGISQVLLGLGGDKSVPTASAVKQSVMAKIYEINESFDREQEAAVALLGLFNEQEAAAALLGLFNSRPVKNTTNTNTATNAYVTHTASAAPIHPTLSGPSTTARIDKGKQRARTPHSPLLPSNTGVSKKVRFAKSTRASNPPRYKQIPTIFTTGVSAHQQFFRGVEYTIECLRNNLRDPAEFMTRFPEYVKHELNIDEEEDRSWQECCRLYGIMAGKRMVEEAAEKTAKKAAEKTAERTAEKTAEKEKLDGAVHRGFWDVI